jgi:hypothetical protein
MLFSNGKGATEGGVLAGDECLHADISVQARRRSARPDE